MAALAAGALVLSMASTGYAIYRTGRSAAEAEALRRLAAENAAAVEFYRDALVRAQDAVARERAQSEALMIANEKLKDHVHAVAKGRASPGVDAAVRGLQPSRVTATDPHVPNPGG